MQKLNKQKIKFNTGEKLLALKIKQLYIRKTRGINFYAKPWIAKNAETSFKLAARRIRTLKTDYRKYLHAQFSEWCGNAEYPAPNQLYGEKALDRWERWQLDRNLAPRATNAELTAHYDAMAVRLAKVWQNDPKDILRVFWREFPEWYLRRFDFWPDIRKQYYKIRESLY